MLVHIGEYYLNKHKPEVALGYFQQALVALLPNSTTTTSKRIPSLESIDPDLFAINALNNKARAFLAIYNTQSHDPENLILSLDTYELVISLIDKIKSSFTTEESKLTLANDIRNAFNGAIFVAEKLYALSHEKVYKVKAFTLSEKSKSALLYDAIRDIDAKILANIPVNLQQEEQGLKEDLASYHNLIYEEDRKKSPDNQKLILWKNKVFKLKQKYDSLIGYFESEYPSYYKLKYDNRVISPDSLQINLKDDQVFIEYTLTDSILITFVITNKTFDTFVQRNAREVIENVNVLRQQFTHQNLINYDKKDFRQFIAVTRQLYNDLILPIEQLLGDKRLIFIPDGELGYLSFDVLLTETVDSNLMDYKRLPYLILKNPISYSSSATILFARQKIEKSSGMGQLVAFAPSYENPNEGQQSSNTPAVSSRGNLLPIPGVKDEVISILKIFQGKKFMDTRATVSNFKKYAEHYDILHLAMHTIIDDKSPMYSKLVFYPEEDSVNGGYINTYELFNMNFHGELAVLSACNTGSGKLENGEGIISLARGFMHSGLSSIVMTLWEVQDHSSAAMISHFYKNLSALEPKDIAMQKAKLEYLASRTCSHPIHTTGPDLLI